jgi:hypothetical protein
MEWAAVEAVSSQSGLSPSGILTGPSALVRVLQRDLSVLDCEAAQRFRREARHASRESAIRFVAGTRERARDLVPGTCLADLGRRPPRQVLD